MTVGRGSATLILNILIFLCGCLDFQYVSTEMTENMEPWNDNKATVAVDFKVHILGGSEECYYQYAHPGAAMYIGYEVISGGDGQASLTIKNPKGEIVFPYEWQQNGYFDEPKSMGGYYTICVGNQDSIFGEQPKLVNIFMHAVRYDWWEKQHKELQALDVNIENFTSSIQTVERNINHMVEYQHHTRGREAWDLSLLSANNFYVVRWSLIQIVVVIIATVVQVYFVRKLFDIKQGGGGFSKPRI